MVELQEFVKDALIGIARGVAEAEGAIGTSTLRIGPRITKVKNDDEKMFESEELVPTTQLIEFDIAVTVTEGRSTSSEVGADGEIKTKGLLAVVGLDAGVKGSGTRKSGENHTDSRISRIKFAVPVLIQGSSDFQLNTRIQFAPTESVVPISVG